MKFKDCLLRKSKLTCKNSSQSSDSLYIKSGTLVSFLLHSPTQCFPTSYPSLSQNASALSISFHFSCITSMTVHKVLIISHSDFMITSKQLYCFPSCLLFFTTATKLIFFKTQLEWHHSLILNPSIVYRCSKNEISSSPWFVCKTLNITYLTRVRSGHFPITYKVQTLPAIFFSFSSKLKFYLLQDLHPYRLPRFQGFSPCLSHGPFLSTHHIAACISLLQRGFLWSPHLRKLSALLYPLW